jgi:hypothetical protein
MDYDVGAAARIGAPDGTPARPAGLQHAVAAGAGATLCGVPRQQLHVFEEITFPHQVDRSCRVCLRSMAHSRAS